MNSETFSVILEPEEEKSIFPMYLTTIQNSGYRRERIADEYSLALVDYFNKHAIILSDGRFTYQSLGLNENILYIDELKITDMYTEPHFHDNIVLSCNDSLWTIWLGMDGNISLEYDD